MESETGTRKLVNFLEQCSSGKHEIKTRDDFLTLMNCYQANVLRSYVSMKNKPVLLIFKNVDYSNTDLSKYFAFLSGRTLGSNIAIKIDINGQIAKSDVYDSREDTVKIIIDMSNINL